MVVPDDPEGLFSTEIILCRGPTATQCIAQAAPARWLWHTGPSGSPGGDPTLHLRLAGASARPEGEGRERQGVNEPCGWKGPLSSRGDGGSERPVQHVPAGGCGSASLEQRGRQGAPAAPSPPAGSLTLGGSRPLPAAIEGPDPRRPPSVPAVSRVLAAAGAPPP